MTVARKLAALWLLTGALPGCAVGVQEAMVAPWLRGNWAYSGTDLVARDPAGGAMPLHVGGDSGQLRDTGTATQLLLALDLPFLRASMAPALMSDPNIEFIQAELLYKHLLVDEPGRRWWLLAGLGAIILNSGVSYSVHPSAATVLAGRKITPDDAINYTARRDATGGYAAVGAQVELTGWMHGYMELLVRLTHAESQVEQISVAAGSNGAALDLTSASSGVSLERQLTGTVHADFNVPVFLLAMGVHFNLPSYHFTRKFISWHAGDPENDEARPDPETPLPVETSPTGL